MDKVFLERACKIFDSRLRLSDANWFLFLSRGDKIFLASLAPSGLTPGAQAFALFVRACIWGMAAIAGHPSGLDDDWALMAPSTAAAASSTQDGQATILFASGIHCGPFGWPSCLLAFGLLALSLLLSFPFACWLPCALWRWKVVRRRVGLCARLRLELVPVAFASLE